MRTLAVMNHKGGVGKTTTTLNLSHALMAMGHRVLMLDMDPQGHLTISSGFASNRDPGLDGLLTQQQTVASIIKPLRDNLALLPAGPKLAEYEQQSGSAALAYRLRNALNDTEGYDFVLIDCPPSSGLLVINAMLASSEVLVPVTGDYLALLGLSRLIGIFRHIEKSLNHHLPLWFVMTRYQGRRKLTRGIRQKLLQYFPGRVLATPIRESVELAESPGFHQSIFDYRPNSYGASDYSDLATDLVNKRVMNHE
ncbi:ParA family protein [Ectothiorhodospiraceae bacterium BW-2]|nr:ParA family protein [Ectothiorhodospiraceae bacterium BW-2]